MNSFVAYMNEVAELETALLSLSGSEIVKNFIIKRQLELLELAASAKRTANSSLTIAEQEILKNSMPTNKIGVIKMFVNAPQSTPKAYTKTKCIA